MQENEPPREKTNNVVSKQVRHKPGCTVTEAGWKLKKKRKYTIRVAKTKAMISFAVTAKLICVFVFAYADCWISHEAAQMNETLGENLCKILYKKQSSC